MFALIYVNTRRVTLIQLNIVCIILNCCTILQIIHIFLLLDLKKDKTAVGFIGQSFEFSKHLPDKASIFTTKLEAIVSALRYIMSTVKKNKFVVFGDSKSALQALLSKWDHHTVQTIMIFFIFFLTYCTYDCYFLLVAQSYGNFGKRTS